MQRPRIAVNVKETQDTLMAIAFDQSITQKFNEAIRRTTKTLWFFVAIFKYLKYTGDKGFIKKVILPL